MRPRPLLRCSSDAVPRGLTLVSTAEVWRVLWARFAACGCGPDAPPAVAFGRETVVIVGRGYAGAAEFAVDLIGVARRRDTTVVSAVWRAPDLDCPVRPAVRHPSVAVAPELTPPTPGRGPGPVLLATRTVRDRSCAE